jgi:uncharacterized protein YcgL (UPF0745 family)
VKNDDLSHIPEDLRQFFTQSPQRNSPQSEEDFTETFRADSKYGEISDMVSQFNNEKQILPHDMPEHHAEYEKNCIEREKSLPNRVPENLIRMFDKPEDHLVTTNSENYKERKSSKVSEMAHVYERNSNTKLSDESSESESDNDHGDHFTISYNENKAVNFEQFEYGGGNVETAEEQDFMDNETLLSGVSFSDRGSQHEELESSDSEREGRIYRENEFQYTKDPNFLLVKNLKNQFENSN